MRIPALTKKERIPALDPAQPDIFRRILFTAALIREKRRIENRVASVARVLMERC